MIHHGLDRFKKQITQIIVLAACYSLILTLAGCEAFIRKFTRKPKKTDQTVELVLTPEEWTGPKMTKEQLYRQYFLFWKSWQDELVEALLQNKSLKKRIDCAEQAIKNLVNLRPLLLPQKQKKLDVYIQKMAALKQRVVNDVYGANNNSIREVAEDLKRSILKDLSYPDIKNFVIQDT